MKRKATQESPKSYCSTTYAGKLLGLSCTSIQSLVEKGDLVAWRTQGGHRRILMSSLIDYQESRHITRYKEFLSFEKIKVLILTDDEQTRNTLTNICKEKESIIECTAIPSAIEALIDINKISPNLLIIDLDMTAIDGIKLLQEIRNYSMLKNLVIVAISANSHEKITQNEDFPQDITFLNKPVDELWLSGFLSAFATLR